ncbi:hypothetical protein [Microbacterium thalassium]|nr:hypothetical protein [Microbacterium thalassium]
MRFAFAWLARRTTVATWIFVAGAIAGYAFGLAVAALQPPLATLLGLATGAAVAAVFAVWGFVESWRTHRRWRRLAEWADDRGWRAAFAVAKRPASDIIGLRGARGRSTHLVDPDTGIRVGDWEYAREWSTRGGWTAHTWGYIEIPLKAPVPHIVVDSRRNRRSLAVRAGADLVPDQVLSLEGDFDDHFTVYCPAGYETDALYFLSPEVMATLIDTAADWDIEFNDDAIVFFRPGSVLAASVHGLDDLAAQAALWEQRSRRWEHWRDHRLGAVPVMGTDGTLSRPRTPVAEPGRTLESNRWWWVLPLAFGGLIVLLYASVVSDMITE